MYKNPLNPRLRFKIVDMVQFVMYKYDISMEDDFITCQHKEDPSKVITIHWLEEIIFHIAKKILEKDDTAINVFMVKCLTEIQPADSDNHCVNYLYERFMRNKEQSKKHFKLDLNLE